MCRCNEMPQLIMWGNPISFNGCYVGGKKGLGRKILELQNEKYKYFSHAQMPENCRKARIPASRACTRCYAPQISSLMRAMQAMRIRLSDLPPTLSVALFFKTFLYCDVVSDVLVCALTFRCQFHTKVASFFCPKTFLIAPFAELSFYPPRCTAPLSLLHSHRKLNGAQESI